jgi:Amt family ammonium transporter
LGKQALAAGVGVVYSVVMTYAIVKLLQMTIGIRASREIEGEGLDMSLHGEAAYTDGTFHESRARA